MAENKSARALRTIVPGFVIIVVAVIAVSGGLIGGVVAAGLISVREGILSIVAITLGGFVSWGITYRYSKQSVQEYRDLTDELRMRLDEKNTLTHFEDLLMNGRWGKEYINDRPVWISETDNTFLIHMGDEGTAFTEEWTEMYPDRSARKYPVYLKIDNSIVKQVNFVSLDGGRIFVPMPELDHGEGERTYSWHMEGLEIKVCKLIGEYYIHGDIYGVARMSRIELME